MTRREFIRKWRVLGATGPHKGPDHEFMLMGTTPIRVPNPGSGHGKGIDDKGLLRRILRDVGVAVDDWLKA